MTKQPKNYFGWVNDHSGSMASLAQAAMRDFNTSIDTVKTATTRESLDAVVSVVGIGLANSPKGRQGCGTKREVVISNPHVLKPMTIWPCPGGTPLYDGIGDMINLLSGLPDANQEHVSFLITITTDGEEQHSEIWTKQSLKSRIMDMQNTGRWTFVFRVPKGKVHTVSDLGVPLDNIQEWETTAAGMAQSTAATTQAMDTYVTQRAAGVRSSSSFYTDTKNVNVSALNDISNEVKLYVSGDVPQDTDGMMISDFILKRRTKYLKGAAFYQLVKTENRVGPEKLILIQERTTGKVYGGAESRKMLGLPNGQNARVTPTDLAGYNIFIQSTSWNRKVPMGSGVLYYEKLGTEFSQEEIDRFMAPPQPKSVVQAPKSAQLPQPKGVVGRNIKSTMPTTQAQDVFYATRDEARYDKTHNGADYVDLGSDKPKGQRFKQTKRPSK